ncbi:MAG: DUF4276 family protein [bacterium]
MVIRVCVEGGDPKYKDAPINVNYRRAFGKVFSAHPPRFLFIMCGSKDEVDKRFRRFIKSRHDRKAYNREIILMLKDSDGNDLKDLRQNVIESIAKELKPSIKPDEDIHFMVQAIEAWFLADRELIRNEYGNDPPDQNPEDIAKPKDVLKGISKSRYRENSAPELLEKISREIVITRCPAFQRFDNRLRNLC